jgi:hypothetical protein
VNVRFNTVDPEMLREAIGRTEPPPDVVLPDPRATLVVSGISD